MIKFLRKCFNEWHQANIDMAEMGIWHIPTMIGLFTYIDENQYREHLKNKEKTDEH